MDKETKKQLKEFIKLKETISRIKTLDKIQNNL